MVYGNRIYLTFNYPEQREGDRTSLTGVRSCGDELYISGFYQIPNYPANGFVYKGEISESHNLKNWHILNVPTVPGRTVTGTNLYGPDILSVHDNSNCDKIRVCGSYTTQENTLDNAVYYEGHLNGCGKWITLHPVPNVNGSVAHSTAHNLIVGNFLVQGDITAHAFIYNTITNHYFEITREGATSISAYGIWYNGDDNYTICGGFSTVNNGDDNFKRIETAYLVDYNSCSRSLSNWRDYNYNKNGVVSIITHFEGITTDNHGGYNLVGQTVLIDESEIIFYAHVDKHNNITYESVYFPGSTSTTGNSIYKKNLIGVYTTENSSSINGYISLDI